MSGLSKVMQMAFFALRSPGICAVLGAAMLLLDPAVPGVQSARVFAADLARQTSSPTLQQSPASTADCPNLLRHTFNKLQTGQPQSLCQYKGKVLLIVNTASFCGYARQYEGLEALYRTYRDRGLVVLGFPSNDFGSQEPGSNKEIAEFCRTTYGIEFPMFEKTGVRAAPNPLYVELATKTGQSPKWNFHKYLIDRSGARVLSFDSAVEPDQREFVSTIERVLAEKNAAP